ncbi:MAG TPA: ROK family protein [Tepidiformaceae bacterium]|nr:ROK family protein [Tepidiformaceae bacterium]
MAKSLAIGVDIGGTGIKAGVVDLETGHLQGDRLTVATPKRGSIAAITQVVHEMVRELDADAEHPLGIGFPAALRRGLAYSAENLADEWQYTDVPGAFSAEFQRPVAVINDGDAAGLAEVLYGSGRGIGGTILVVTLGTGVGTSLIHNGRLIPNIELGRLPVRGKPAGERVANSVRTRKKLSWAFWARDLGKFIEQLDTAASPEMVIIGGGVSKKAHKFIPLINVPLRVVPASLRNDAGIVGAAANAAFTLPRPKRED